MITDDHKSIVKAPNAMDEDEALAAPSSAPTPSASAQQPSSAGPRRTTKRRLAASTIKEEDASEGSLGNAAGTTASGSGTVRANKRRATRESVQSYKDASPSPTPVTVAPTSRSSTMSISASQSHSRRSSTQAGVHSRGSFTPTHGRGFSPAMSVASSSAYTTTQPHSAFTTAPSSPLINSASSPSLNGNGNGVFLHYPVTSSSETSPSIPHAQQHTAASVLSQNTLQQQLQQQVYRPQLFLRTTEQMEVEPTVERKPLDMALTEPVDTDALFSAFTSYGASPSSSSVISQPQTQPQVQAQSLPSAPDSTPPAPPPQIHRLIPASGPTHGGIEVTILGANFLPSHRCVFGDTVAASTQMWSENTLVCVLPPAATPGPVVVGFEGVPLGMGAGMGGLGLGIGIGGMPGTDRGLQLFNYLDNSDRAL